MEDLDTQRTSEEYAQILREDLRWLGLDYDRETPPQSTRSAVYDRYFDKLAQMGLLYPCYCTRSQLHSVNAPHLSDGTYVYPGTCRNLTEAQRATFHRAPAWRVRVPDRVWTVEDRVQGHYECNLATDCGDMVVRRADGVYVYQPRRHRRRRGGRCHRGGAGDGFIKLRAPADVLAGAAELSPPGVCPRPQAPCPDGRR